MSLLPLCPRLELFLKLLLLLHLVFLCFYLPIIKNFFLPFSYFILRFQSFSHLNEAFCANKMVLSIRSKYSSFTALCPYASVHNKVINFYDIQLILTCRNTGLYFKILVNTLCCILRFCDSCCLAIVFLGWTYSFLLYWLIWWCVWVKVSKVFLNLHRKYLQLIQSRLIAIKELLCIWLFFLECDCLHLLHEYFWVCMLRDRGLRLRF